MRPQHRRCRFPVRKNFVHQYPCLHIVTKFTPCNRLLFGHGRWRYCGEHAPKGNKETKAARGSADDTRRHRFHERILSALIRNYPECRAEMEIVDLNLLIFLYKLNVLCWAVARRAGIRPPRVIEMFNSVMQADTDFDRSVGDFLSQTTRLLGDEGETLKCRYLLPHEQEFMFYEGEYSWRRFVQAVHRREINKFRRKSEEEQPRYERRIFQLYIDALTLTYPSLRDL